VEIGPVVATIMRVAAEEAADLIAMASHGRGGPTDVYYGSVAAGILQRIDRPLLIVRGQ
jgi:nucleotide-binding universal stress UspA family protein